MFSTDVQSETGSTGEVDGSKFSRTLATECLNGRTVEE